MATLYPFRTRRRICRQLSTVSACLIAEDNFEGCILRCSCSSLCSFPRRHLSPCPSRVFQPALWPRGSNRPLSSTIETGIPSNCPLSFHLGQPLPSSHHELQWRNPRFAVIVEAPLEGLPRYLRIDRHHRILSRVVDGFPALDAASSWGCRLASSGGHRGLVERNRASDPHSEFDNRSNSVQRVQQEGRASVLIHRWQRTLPPP